MDDNVVVRFAWNVGTAAVAACVGFAGWAFGGDWRQCVVVGILFIIPT
jgi:hypothetical protein